MLQKPQRLRKRKDFSQTYSRGRSYVHPLLVLYLRPVREGGTRFGFSISKKLGGAVERNRIKRRLREVCREELLSELPGFDAIFVGRGRLKTATFREMQAVVHELLQRAKVVDPKSKREEQSCSDLSES